MTPWISTHYSFPIYYRRFNKKTVAVIEYRHNTYMAKVKINKFLEVYELKSFKDLHIACIWADIYLINLGYKVFDPFIIFK